MQEYLLIQGEYVLRLLGAAVCGAFIGYERENHLKMAGIRTHILVSLTASLMMILSKYGFFDVIQNSSISLDPSRIAASIVTAVGFLGAGVIFTRKMNVSGLTTAAGIWATVGIGMSFGAGMYLLGFVTTLFILLMQFIFHKNKKFFKTPTVEQITICVKETEDVHTILENAFTSKKIKIANFRATRLSSSRLEIRLSVKFPDTFQIDDILTLLKETQEITSIDI